MILSRRRSALSRWFLPCVLLTLAAQAAAGEHQPGLAWQKDKDGRQSLVWEAKSGKQVRLLDPHVVLADPKARAKWSLKLEPSPEILSRYRPVVSTRLRWTINSAALPAWRGWRWPFRPRPAKTPSCADRS